MIILAVDISGTKLAAALTGADRQTCDRRKLPTPASQTPEVLCDILSALVSPLQARVQWAAITSAGIIRGGSLLALNPHNLGGLLHFPSAKALEQLTNLPTTAINDVQAAAWVEFQALDGGITDMTFITASTGVGGGVVSGCKLPTGPGGLAGHTGRTLADPHGPVCGCGRIDYVEAIVSGHDIATAAQRELAGTDTKTIFIRTGQGDGQTQQLIRRFVRILARLIVDIKITADHQYVVVGGSAGLVEGYLALMETYPTQEPAIFHVDLLVAHCRRDVGLLGVALLTQGEKL